MTTNTQKADLGALGTTAMKMCVDAGAHEVTIRVGRSVSTELSQRDGQLEKCEESRSLSLSAELLVNERYSVHSTSDLRNGPLRAFLARAVEATRHLEPDANRLLPDRADMGMADVPLTTLDLVDENWGQIQPQERRRHVEDLEKALVLSSNEDPVRSITTYVWDGETERIVVCSNGFEGAWKNTAAGRGATISMEDADGRLPEAYGFFQSCHLEDLPSNQVIAQVTRDRAMRRIGSGPTESGRYPLLLTNHAAGRLLGILLGPMGGHALYEGRSCLKDRLHTQIGAKGLSLLDRPHIPRGLGSRPYDGDGRPTQDRALIEDGMLNTYLLDVYNARRLHQAPTTGGTSNLVVPPGQRTPQAILNGLPKAIEVEGFLGGNANPVTGDFSFGIHGTLFENGESTKRLSEMNISGNIFAVLDRWLESANDPYRYSSWRTPAMLFDGVQFSGTAGG